jgi:large subunit ribosomal protein L24
MNKIRKGDLVQVIAGKDKGRSGKVLQVLRRAIKKNKSNTGTLWVIVEGLNIVKKHVKGNPQQQKPGGIIPKEAPLSVCKVALIDSSTNKPSRVGIKVLEDGRKVRYFKASGEVVDV